ncbi:Gldg family protein [Marinicella sp. S1101]|uniref:GldG family protein n=1 Tax=Marinicella marina TaxID=2996016 RepID=UPI002260C3BF|nr:Gldg family protein [Marinicella marina]MCX7553562.1 Gldg family protein [Marinicella marina]MDJ1140186.1 Gldg family protein [Marinicella marina]
MKNQTHKVQLLILAVIFLLVSVIINQSGIFSKLRVDLTENDLFTLNEGSINILQNIDEKIHLRLFYSDQATENIPLLRTYHRRVVDFLQELARYGSGKLKITMVDPVSFSEEEDQASQYGLQPLPVGEGGENVFFGIAATNALDDVEIIPFLQPDREAFLEYDVAQLIYNLNNPAKRKVGVMSDLPLLGSFDPQAGQIPGQIIFEQLREMYEIVPIETTATTFDDVDLLLVVHPKNLTEGTLFAIDQFVMNGGRLLAFVDPMAQAEEIPADPQNPMAQIQADRSSDLAVLFAAWGIGFDKNQVILDNQQAVSIQSGQGQTIRHLGINSWNQSSFNQSDIVTSDLTSLNTALAGALTAEGDKLLPILTSSTQSMLTANDAMSLLFNPNALFQNFNPDDQSHVIAARVNGGLDTAFPSGIEGETELITRVDQANVVIFADVDVLFDRMWVRAQNFFGRQIYSNFADNGTLINNLIDNMTGSADLIQVRARGTSNRPFDKVLEIQRRSEQKYRETENQLMQQLRETESKLNELQSIKGQENQLIISQEQQQEIAKFKQRKLEVRKSLREVKRNLNKDIEELGTELKFINIALVPMLLTLVIVFLSWRKSKRKERAYV